MTALNLKENRQPLYEAEFLDRCISLFMGFEAGHMGSDVYHDHPGQRLSVVDGKLQSESMSGVVTWEQHAKNGTIPILSRGAFFSRLDEISSHIIKGLPVIEYGPGSMEDAHRLILAVQSKLYIPIDLSEDIIQQASSLASSVGDCEIRPLMLDFFTNNHIPLIKGPTFAALLGLTITNIRGPVPLAEPKNALIKAFYNLMSPMNKYGGYLLVSTHSDQDGERNKQLYSEKWHKHFGENLTYRMYSELPMKDFNPDLFEYYPVWHEHCSLLAHTLRATHKQTFTMGNQNEIKIYINAGDIFHFNNSYKYRAEFFEECARLAGLKIIRKWDNEENFELYLFEVPSLAI